MIKLYDYWRSSASYRTRIALALADEQWQTQTVNLRDAEHRSKAHLTRNPQGRVPVLEIDGHCLTQSLAQIEYLDETRQLGLLPSAPIERAEVRALSYAIAMDIHPVCNLNVAEYAVEQSDQQITATSWMTHFIGKGLNNFESMVTGLDYCYGETVSLADICLMPQLYNAERWGINLQECPKISRIKENLAGIAAFRNAHPDACARN